MHTIRSIEDAKALEGVEVGVSDWVVIDQHRILCWKLRGHDAYYGITGNYRRLEVLRLVATRLWQKWLNRRSQRSDMPWERFALLLERYPLPAARVVHSVFRRAANPRI